MKAGDTFLPLLRNTHLWVILSDPDLDSERIVLVNLTTYTIDEESHCILQKGDHPFVRHKTAVRYEEARIVSSAELSKLLKNHLTQRERMSGAVLKRIRDGASKSDRLREECRRVLDEQGLI